MLESGLGSSRALKGKPTRTDLATFAAAKAELPRVAADAEAKSPAFFFPKCGR